MRYTRSVTAVILTFSLILILCLSVSADGGITEDIVIDFLEADYKGQTFVMHTPQVSRNMYIFPNIDNPNPTTGQTLSSITLLGYPTSGPVDWQEGYIYTFNYKVQISLIQKDILPIISFGIATINDDYTAISEYVSLSDVTYTYTRNGTDNSGYTYTYRITSVVKVDDTFNNGGIEDYSNTYLALNIRDIFTISSSKITVISNNMTANKAVGEDAYYQASLDAINNLPQTEYDYIYNSMPDSEGEADVVIGDINEVYAQFNPFFNQITNLFQSDVAKPCVYLPKVEIPFLNIKIFEPHVFYIDDYLNSMDSDIMDHIDVVVWFIRFSACVGFIYVGFYKISRIEWWS